MIHTRSGNSKWLVEISHKNPLWIHPQDAARFGDATNDLLRVTTEIGYFVIKCWVTEGIRPGVVACSHHMGRWRLQETGMAQWSSALVSLEHAGDAAWRMRTKRGITPFQSSDTDSARVWWTDAGVPQNLTFPVHPDPISGMHCWHQKVTLARAEPGDRYGDVYVDTDRSHAVYKAWLAMTRPADTFSPDGTRRPYWMLRPFRPNREMYALPAAHAVSPPRAAPLENAADNPDDGQASGRDG
jgi:anaerobic selenocysteine-containing dehydrogenase